MSGRPPIVVICGPTASGKTGLAVELAQRFDAEVINADSMQVFRGFDIGTAKPDTEERQGIPHHLIDIADPTEPFDAARFTAVADAAAEEIAARGKRVLVAGGTGLYIRALLHGLQAGPPPDPVLRESLNRRAEIEGPAVLHQELTAVDPEAAARLHPNDRVRVVRALEVAISSGVTLSEWQQRHGFKEDRYRFLLLAIEHPRETLGRIIDDRVERMMAAGFLEEVKQLLAASVPSDAKPMQALGYKRLVAHLLGEISLSEAVEQIKTDTRRFAKRQMTWFRKEPGLQWILPNVEAAVELCTHFWNC